MNTSLDNLHALNNCAVPLWLVTGLRKPERKRLISAWSKAPSQAGPSHKKNIFSIDLDMLLDGVVDENDDQFCYHCVAELINVRIEDLVFSGSLAGKHIMLEVSSDMNLSGLLYHLEKIKTSEKSFRLRGVFNALNEKSFLTDYNGVAKKTFLTRNRSVAEALCENIETANIFVSINSSSDKDLINERIDSIREKSIFLNLDEFVSEKKQIADRCLFSAADMQKNLNIKKIINNCYEGSFAHQRYESDIIFDAEKLSLAMQSVPSDIIRSFGYVWIWEGEPRLYNLSLVGEGTVTLESSCPCCVEKVVVGAQSGKSYLATVARNKGAILQFEKQLCSALLSEFEMKSAIKIIGEKRLNVKTKH